MSDATPVSTTPYKRWCFTINNPVNEPQLHEKLKYLVYGRETAPTSGTPHLQGYLETHSNIRITGLHKIPGFESAHFIQARGTPQQNRDYCTKGGDFVEFGTISAGRGERTDLAAVRDILKEQPNRAGLKRVLDEYPGDFIRYHGGLEKAMKLLRPDLPVDTNVELREWQVELMDLFEEHSPHPRKIFFFVDPQGAAGKSFFCRHFFSLYPSKTVVLSNAKFDRLYNAYNGEKYVFFDLTRSPDDEHDQYPYQVMENIKNGYKPPGMYGSLPEFHPVPHVVVMCNQTPKMTALSSDRYEIKYLSGAYQ